MVMSHTRMESCYTAAVVHLQMPENVIGANWNGVAAASCRAESSLRKLIIIIFYFVVNLYKAPLLSEIISAMRLRGLSCLSDQLALLGQKIYSLLVSFEGICVPGGMETRISSRQNN